MKVLAAFFLWTAIGLALVGCSIGRVSPQVQLSPAERDWLAAQKIPLAVTVVSAKGKSPASTEAPQLVCVLATNLSRTRPFTKVVTSEADSQPDLLAMVREARGVQRCGNPQYLARATLGLVRDRIAYSYSYDFDLRSPQTGKSLCFQTTYRGQCHVGFWPAPDAAFIDLLKLDLAKMRAEIESLTQQ